jgi:hypothetical protein
MVLENWTNVDTCKITLDYNLEFGRHFTDHFVYAYMCMYKLVTSVQVQV